MYLVDTNVLSEARRGTAVARDWLQSVDPNMIYLSVITLGGIMKGIALKQRTDPRAASPLHQWLEQLRYDHAERILPITVVIAIEWGRMALPRSGSMADGLIAATASFHRKIVVTRNSRDFDDYGIPVINPWQP